MINKYASIIILFFLFASVSFAGTSTWTGASSSDWTVAGNWTGGVPSGPSDIVVLPAGASNTSIINVPTVTIKRLEVTGGTYTLNASSAVTLTCSAGGAGDELTISTGASLTTLANVSIVTGGRPVNIVGSFIANGPVTFAGTVVIAGTANLNNSFNYTGTANISVSGSLYLNCAFSATNPATISGNGTTFITGSSACTLNQSVSFQNTLAVAGTLTVSSPYTAAIAPLVPNTAVVSSAGTIDGAGNVTHSSGTFTVNGLVVNTGNFTNSAVMGGTGTVEVGGAISNTSTMFGYSGNPPGKILSGYTWSGASSNLWTNSANWYGSLVPVSTGDAVIYSSADQPELDQPSQVCRQLYIHSGAELTITADGQLTANGRTRIGQPNGISIESSATSTGSFIDNGNISYSGGGSVLVQQYLIPDQWHGYCLPFTTASTNPFIDYYMKWFDESDAHYYKYVIDPGQTDSSWTKPGLGFLMWSSSATTNTTPVSPSGLLNTGAVAIPVTRTWNSAGFPSPPWPSASGAGYDGFNLVGNLYPSAIDLNNAAVTWTNVDEKAWFYNPTSGNWEEWIKAGGGTRTSSIAAVQQGFFIHCNDAAPIPPAQGSGSIGFTNAARIHSTEAFLKESVADMLTLKVINAANGYFDLAVVRFTESATAGLDPQLDGEKLTGQAEAPQLYFPIPDSWPLSVNALPWTGINMTVPLSFSMLPETNNQIEASGIETFNQGTQVILEDKKLNLFHNLVTDPNYQFTSSPADSPVRFVLHFTKSTIGIDDPPAGFQVYAYGGEVYVKNVEGGTTNGIVRIYDLTGRNLYTFSLLDLPVNRFSPGTDEGYYIVRVISRDAVVIRKVYLH